MCTFCAADNGTCDRPIDPTNQNQYIVWGIGSLGATAFQHHTRATSMCVGCILRETYYCVLNYYFRGHSGNLVPSPLPIFLCYTQKTIFFSDCNI